MNRAGRTIQPSRKRGSKDPLTVIPSIGPSLAADLRLLGVGSVADLKGADPEQMYEELCRKTRARQDPCVLDSFRCAVYYATSSRHNPERLKWWTWKNRSKIRPTS